MRGRKPEIAADPRAIDGCRWCVAPRAFEAADGVFKPLSAHRGKRRPHFDRRAVEIERSADHAALEFLKLVLDAYNADRADRAKCVGILAHLLSAAANR